MPVSVRSAQDPFRSQPHPEESTSTPLRVPQARVLQALMPADPDTYWTEWPSIDAHYLALALGTSTKSDLVRRALRGLPPGSSSGDAHDGLLAKGYAEAILLDVDGVRETQYRITHAGILALREYLKRHQIPKMRSTASCVNKRYKKMEPPQ